MEQFTQQVALMPNNDRRYCVPVALAIVSDKSAADISADMIGKGIRKPRQGVYESNWAAYAKQTLGLTLNPVTQEVRRAGGKTVRSVERVLNPSYKYLIVVRGHVLAYSDGKIQDWSAMRKNRLQTVYQVMCGSEVDSSEPIIPKVKNVRGTLKQDCFIRFSSNTSVADVAKRVGITYANAHYYYRCWKKENDQ